MGTFHTAKAYALCNSGNKCAAATQVGAVVKPMAGMIDMVSQTSEGIRNTPEYMSRKGAAVVRVRLPRHWEKGTAVRGFDRRHAMGSALLTVVANRMGWRADDVGVMVDYLCWSNPVCPCSIPFHLCFHHLDASFVVQDDLRGMYVCMSGSAGTCS